MTGSAFAVAPGERIGVVGASGGGKSSIVRLLLRFYDPVEGAIRLGGHDLRRLSFEQIRGMISVVNQDTFLFHGTVEANIRMGRPDASDADVRAAARGRQHPRFHRGAAQRLRHGDRRARHQAVRRPAPAHRDRARDPARFADPGAGRGAVRGRCRERGGDPERARPPDARAHHAHLRASPLQRDRLRPHPGAVGWPGGRRAAATTA